MGEREAVTWDTREELVEALEAAEIDYFGDDKQPIEVIELIEHDVKRA
jgi:hypothetical protein